MERVSLNDLRNEYIPPDDYIRLGNTVRIVPLYPQNRQSLRVEDLRNLKYVRDTTFRFIIEFKKNEDDTFSKFYTSETMFDDLKKEFDMGNPFFTRTEIPTVKVYTDNLKDTILGSSNEEQSLNVELRNNMGYDPNTDKFDYDVIVNYIDWLVKPSTLEEDSSLIPSKEYSNYETIEPL